MTEIIADLRIRCESASLKYLLVFFMRSFTLRYSRILARKLYGFNLFFAITNSLINSVSFK